MKLTQGTFSFLPDLDDEQIRSQVEYCLQNGWAVSIEYTDDPHPRNSYWEMFGTPMFDIRDAAGILTELRACRQTFPEHYIKLNAFDSTHGRESLRLSFIVGRPARSRDSDSSGRKGRAEPCDIRLIPTPPIVRKASATRGMADLGSREMKRR